MKRVYMKFTIILPFLFAAILSGQPIDSNEELVRRIKDLEQRMSNLEKVNDQTQKNLTQVEKKADEAKTASQSNLIVPQSEEAKKSFMSKLRNELKSDEVKSQGAWTKKETWSKMRRNLTEFKVRKLLGNPIKIKGSLSPRIDRVYHYHGDLDADGIEETAFVNFFKGKSVSFESPF